MIGNILPTEATHTLLDLFETPALPLTFDGIICQKVGPVYSPNGLMLEFEVSGDRNNFIYLPQKKTEIKYKVVYASEADLKCSTGAATDVTKTNASYFCKKVMHSLFSDSTASAKGKKVSNAIGNYAHKSSNETELSHNKSEIGIWLACQSYSYDA